MYLLPILYHAHDILIGCSVVAPVHEKDVADGIKYTEKTYLSMLMKTLQLPNAATNNYQMEMHKSTENEDISLAK